MKCDNCKNKDICKHVEYMQSIEDKINDLNLNKDISIRAEIKCGYMQEKNCTGINVKELTSYPNKVTDVPCPGRIYW